MSFSNFVFLSYSFKYVFRYSINSFSVLNAQLYSASMTFAVAMPDNSQSFIHSLTTAIVISENSQAHKDQETYFASHQNKTLFSRFLMKHLVVIGHCIKISNDGPDTDCILCNGICSQWTDCNSCSRRF